MNNTTSHSLTENFSQNVTYKRMNAFVPRGPFNRGSHLKFFPKVADAQNRLLNPEKEKIGRDARGRFFRHSSLKVGTHG